MTPSQKIALPIGKSSEIKVYRPIINALIKNKVNVFLMCGPNPTRLYPKNPESNPTKENLNITEGENTNIIYYQDIEDLEKKLRDKKITDLISINNPSNFKNLSHITQTNKINLFYLQSFFDFIYMPPESLNNIDGFFLYSEEMINLYLKAHPSTSKDQIKKFIPVGNPMMDLVSKIPPQKSLKKKYKIPNNKKVILLLTTNPNINFWTKYIFSSKNKIKAIYRCLRHKQIHLIPSIFKDTPYKKIIYYINMWAKKNNAVIVAKTKLKHKDRDLFKDSVDIFINEDTENPNLSLELIKMSDLVISFEYSSSILEAIINHKYSLQIITNNPDNTKSPFANIIKKSNVFNKEVCRIINQNKLKNFLKKHSINDFTLKPEVSESYTKKYIGALNGQSSQNIVDYIVKKL